MLAAAGGEAGDLNTLYLLLRWNPEVLYDVGQEDSTRLDYGVGRKQTCSLRDSQ